MPVAMPGAMVSALVVDTVEERLGDHQIHRLGDLQVRPLTLDQYHRATRRLDEPRVVARLSGAGVSVTQGPGAEPLRGLHSAEPVSVDRDTIDRPDRVDDSDGRHDGISSSEDGVDDPPEQGFGGQGPRGVVHEDHVGRARYRIQAVGHGTGSGGSADDDPVGPEPGTVRWDDFAVRCGHDDDHAVAHRACRGDRPFEHGPVAQIRVLLRATEARPRTGRHHDGPHRRVVRTVHGCAR